jgi:hypothetical protein
MRLEAAIMLFVEFPPWGREKNRHLQTEVVYKPVFAL